MKAPLGFEYLLLDNDVGPVLSGGPNSRLAGLREIPEAGEPRAADLAVINLDADVIANARICCLGSEITGITVRGPELHQRSAIDG